MKNFGRVMDLLFGSVGTHTYPKSGQVAPPPPPESDWFSEVLKIRTDAR